MEAPRSTVRNAKSLRRKLSLPEVLLWQRIRRGQLDGLHIRRQHPIGPYILDFYCNERKLCIEVDGYAHSTEDRPQRDQRRDNWLAEQGVRTLRLRAQFVLSDMDGAITTIRAAMDEQVAGR